MYVHLLVGEYLKDIDRILLPIDPNLNMSMPLPLTERDACGDVFEILEDDAKEDGGELKRDCYAEAYPQDISTATSKVYVKHH